MIRRLISPRHLLFFFITAVAPYLDATKGGGDVFTSVACHEHNPTLVCASLFLSGNPFFPFVCLHGHRAVPHLGERSGGEISPNKFFKMSSRRNAPLLLRLRAKARSSIFSPAAAHPHQNVSAKSRRFVFASRRQLLSPKVQSPVLCTRRNPQRVLDPRHLFSRRANKCSAASPRGVTSAHGLRPRCLHDTGARSADCGPQKNQMEALFAAPAARKSLTRRHRANTAPLHGFTRGSFRTLQSGPASAKRVRAPTLQ